MDVIEDLLKQVRNIQNFIVEKVAKSEYGKQISNQDARLINESLSSLSAVIDNCNYEPHNKVILQKTYRIALDTAYEKLFYYAGYYYLYSKIVKGDLYEQQEALFQVNVNTATAISVIEGYRNGICGIGGSTDDYYITRMHRAVWGLEYILKHSTEELYIPSLYVLYNLSQSLSLYLNSGHEEYKDEAVKQLKVLLTLQEKFHKLDTIKQILLENKQLELFRLYQYNIAENVLQLDKTKIEIQIDDLKNFKSENTLRILSTLFHFDKEQFILHFESKYLDITTEISKQNVGLNTFLFVKCLAQYYSAKGMTEVLDFDLRPLQKNELDFSEHINSVFNNYNQSASVDLVEGELAKLIAYNDDILREKVSKTIIGVDPNLLSRESKKPHGVSEISDMEIPLKLNGKRFYMCMPFKSGLEISGNSVPESISYQIFRPFLHFDNCIVVFVTAKRSSQNLMNYIKRMQSKLGWSISVIENEELAKLLKINGQLN